MSEIINIDISNKKHKKRNLNMWAYIFLIPFFVVFIAFQLVPLGETIYYSFFEYYYDPIAEYVGPNFIGFKNYVTLLTNPAIWKYMGNTVILWIIGALPQFIIALILALIFTDMRLKIKGQRFFKTVIYMPNLVMASAFGMLFLQLFGQSGPINLLLKEWGILQESFRFTSDKTAVRLIIAFINFIMWFGNTTLLLMSGIMGIDESIFESARIDGAGAARTLKDVTFPLLLPIFVYTFITSMIGGLQMFDAAEIFTQGSGGPASTSKTIMMTLYNYITYAKDYGRAGALSTILFIITAILSVFVFKTLTPTFKAAKEEKIAAKKRERWIKSDVKAAMQLSKEEQ
ncbi:MAG: sugar ABC transporter permease [Bacilli bacterium]|nr:sugar ABC transporter permease [Bacilli bacterium]